MDLVYQRYSNPLTLLDSLIENRMFSNHIDTLNEKVIFDFEFKVWLHKVDDKSFNDWRNELHSNAEARSDRIDENELKATVLKSSDLLNSFEP